MKGVSTIHTQRAAGANQPVHWFLGGEGLGMQQGTSVWVGLPKSKKGYVHRGLRSKKPQLSFTISTIWDWRPF